MSTYLNQVYGDNRWVDITVSDFWKGRYNLLIYVGIDIAKLNHYASAISADG